MFDVIVNYQAVLPRKNLTADLEVKLVCTMGEINLAIKFEEVQDPLPEVRL